MQKQIVIYGGGTFSHVRSHLALAAPAFGSTAVMLDQIIRDRMGRRRIGAETIYHSNLRLTKMADSGSNMVTNDDVAENLTEVVQNEATRAVIMNAALCDYRGSINSAKGDKYAARLHTDRGNAVIDITPADKLLNTIRKERKDIFLVAFKTTCGATPEDQYKAGLNLLKGNSCNLVWANDVLTRNNMLIVPEEAAYSQGESRKLVAHSMVDMMLSRMDNTFTRSRVIEGPLIKWEALESVGSMKQVVEHCVSKGAYRPINGKTAGHFAIKVNDKTLMTSRRKSNFNETLDLVIVDSTGADTVTAMGAKPSVGGQSQRIIFKEHEEDCIVHFHCEQKPGSKVQKAVQHPFECGSHQCGQNTSDNLGTYSLGEGYYLKAVMLDNHGPNIVFNRHVPAEKVINFIEQNWDLSHKSGGFNVQGW